VLASKGKALISSLSALDHYSPLYQYDVSSSGGRDMRRRFIPILGALLGAAATAAGASASGNAGTTSVVSFDVAGAVFTCPGTEYTVVDGTLRFVFHHSIAADGSEHLTSKRVPTAVTLTDGSTTTVYRLVGANAAGGNVNLGSSDSFEFTDVTMFNILAPGDGIVDRVASVTHVGPTGSEFSFTFGECEPPQG
jgi:hypothetical protein